MHKRLDPSDFATAIIPKRMLFAPSPIQRQVDSSLSKDLAFDLNSGSSPQYGSGSR